MTSCGHISYMWDGKQLVGICLLPTDVHISYSYNEDGLRVGKRVSWSSMGVEWNTEYYYNDSVLTCMKTGNTVQRFSYDAQGKVVAVDYSENCGSSYTTYYYLRNAQGDIVKLIDNGGDTKVEYTYDSWGKVLSTTGDHAGGIGLDQPFRYRGYVYDSDTNLYYLQSRYYNPSLGRFISSDVYLSTGQGVLGHNSYAYCLNNPVNAEDPTGYWGWFSSGKGKQDEEDAGWCGGLSSFTGWARRIWYRPSSAATTISEPKKIANTITGYTKHGVNQAISRNNVGVKPSAILDTVRNPIKVSTRVDELGRISIQYRGAQATVVLNKTGKVVSCWAKSSMDWRQ